HGDGLVIDLTENRVATGPAADRPRWALPERWSSRRRRALDYSPGYRPSFAGQRIGSPAQPWTFRVSFDAFLRFVRWQGGRYAPVAEGLEVRAVDLDALGRAQVLGQGTTDAEGRAHVSLDEGADPSPDLHFVLTREDGRAWSSAGAFAVGEPNRRGVWRDFPGSRVGHPRSPYVFEVSGRRPGWLEGNQVEALIDGPATLAALERAIDAAQASIHAEVMFLFDDPIGRRIAERLMRRAREGVRVRLMVDVRTTGDAASHINLRKIWVRALLDLEEAEREAWLARLEAAQRADEARGDLTRLLAELRATPNLSFVDTSFPYVELEPEAVPGAPEAYRELEAALPLVTLARIDHRKFFVFDGAHAILGGMNLGSEYLYAEPIDPTLDAEAQARASATEPWVKWHDTMVSVRGPAVRPLQQLFHERWTTEGGEDFEPGDLLDPGAPGHPTAPPIQVFPEGLPARVLDTTPGARFDFHATTLRLIDGAQREIRIANAYFSSNEVVAHLLRALARGVAVQLLFPGRDHNDSLDFYYSGLLKYPRLLAAGAEIHELRHHMNHSKVAVFDDVSLIGSGNYNHSSFFHHYELGLLVRDPDFTRRFVAERFEPLLASAVRIQPGDLAALRDLGAVGTLWLEGVVDRRF
ncbi:MAG: phosphatidylserine/phosphatidylglycerophosphate/cardiolipin synthase family protein, partial [Alphaproteobacteria bacterium]|nr:phosphatidylserine/phosphatidylglycerophosphate/cardiolipin synthase family protein [Alphaproteobacteria bacterium]